MKVFVVLLAVVGFGTCLGENACYNSVLGACSAASKLPDDTECDAKYGAFDGVEIHLQEYVNTHIAHSFDYLLMSTHFGNYKFNRDGLKHLFRKLSDSTWDDAIDLIKYITKRGGVMDFGAISKKKEPKIYEQHELGSLAQALDIQKSIAEGAHLIHKEVTRNKEHDPEVASFLENQFVHKHADNIRMLSGHTNDLKRMIKDNSQASLATFLFDEYLQKL